MPDVEQSQPGVARPIYIITASIHPSTHAQNYCTVIASRSTVHRGLHIENPVKLQRPFDLKSGRKLVYKRGRSALALILNDKIIQDVSCSQNLTIKYEFSRINFVKLEMKIKETGI